MKSKIMAYNLLNYFFRSISLFIVVSAYLFPFFLASSFEQVVWLSFGILFLSFTFCFSADLYGDIDEESA
jgi:hypothetical protein